MHLFSVLDEQECKYQCYECAKRFKTSIALQRHLITHEPGAPQPSTSCNESQITPSENHSSESLPESTYSAIKRKYKPQPKKIKVDNSQQLIWYTLTVLLKEIQTRIKDNQGR